MYIFVYMYICMYVYMHIYIYMYIGSSRALSQALPEPPKLSEDLPKLPQRPCSIKGPALLNERTHSRLQATGKRISGFLVSPVTTGI